MQIRCTFISGAVARANKLRVSDASVRQRLVQVLGNVIMQAVSNKLILVGSQANSLFEKVRAIGCVHR